MLLSPVLYCGVANWHENTLLCIALATMTFSHPKANCDNGRLNAELQNYMSKLLF